MNDDWNPDHVRLTIGRNLREITTLYNQLPDEAAHHANNPQLPGGDALHLHGPAANLQAWEHRYETNEAAGGPDYADDQIDTDLHPLLVLATWEDQLREARNQPTDLRAQVDRAAAYIEHSINWMLDPNQHPQTGVWLPIDALNTDL